MSSIFTEGSRRVRNMRLETIFVLIFLLFGFIFVCLVPPGWNTDEYDHSFRIFQLSRGDILSEQVQGMNGLKAYGGLVPVNLVRFFDETGAHIPGVVEDPATKASTIYKGHPDIMTLRDDGKRMNTYFSGAALYSPVTYAEYIPVFWIGKLFLLPFFWIIMFCRIVGLLITCLAFYLSIRFIPIGKWAIFTVGLIPTVVVQAASVGADAPQLAITVLFIMLVCRQIYAKTETRVLDYALLAITGSVLTLVKIAYAPLLLLLLALPLIKKEQRSWKHIGYLFATFVVAVVPAVIWIDLVSYIDINSNPQANFVLQKAFIVHRPLQYLKTVYYTFFTNEQVPLSHLFGSFIWASVPLPAIYEYLSTTAVILCLFVVSSREKIMVLGKKATQIWKGALILSGIVTVLLITAALYIYSTTLQQSTIVGIQARYFLPLLPLLLLIFYGNKVQNQRAVKISIVTLSCVVLLGSVLVVFHRLYQTLPLILH